GSNTDAWNLAEECRAPESSTVPGDTIWISASFHVSSSPVHLHFALCYFCASTFCFLPVRKRCRDEAADEENTETPDDSSGAGGKPDRGEKHHRASRRLQGQFVVLGAGGGASGIEPQTTDTCIYWELNLKPLSLYLFSPPSISPSIHCPTPRSTSLSHFTPRRFPKDEDTK
ncbi:unnamed protein product, partial [Pleuronectes platessa]